MGLKGPKGPRAERGLKGPNGPNWMPNEGPTWKDIGCLVRGGVGSLLGRIVGSHLDSPPLQRQPQAPPSAEPGRFVPPLWLFLLERLPTWLPTTLPERLPTSLSLSRQPIHSYLL